MVILCFGDVFAKPGRHAVAEVLPALRAKYSPDLVIANVENLAGGRGVSHKAMREISELGFDGFTSGNHIWDNREVLEIFEKDHRLIRPANYPNRPGDPCPGRGHAIVGPLGKQILLINLMGRVFMDAVDCPFAAVSEILRQNEFRGPILVDMHAETTSEKYAMGWFLDGRVTAVVGTHTHVQTSDERLLPKGTAYISDIGMTGSFDSVIGMGTPEVVRKFVTKRPHRVQPASENAGFGCVIVETDGGGRATRIVRIRQTLREFAQTKGTDWPV